jgi:hypothetical protein
VATRRTTWLVVVAVLGGLLLPLGVLLVWSGVGGDHGGRTVAGILLGLAGLVCLRILWWVRRIRRMTRAGLAFHVEDDAGRGGGG